MLDGEELTTGRVLRAGCRNRGPGTDTTAIGLDFQPSSDDIRTGSVTVWDSELTTPSQALSMMSGPDSRPVFRLNVDTIRKLGYRALGDQKQRNLRVLRELLPPEQRKQPGADGHCGIRGLIRPAGVKRALYRELLDELAEISEIVQLP